MISLLGIAYLGAHIALYAFWLRHRNAFASERGIFAYHLVSVVAASVVLGGSLLIAPDAVRAADVVLFLSLHAIYSMSFLELWALADGGYSLSILDCLDSNKELPPAVVLEELAKLGTIKKQGRIGDLIRLGLVRADNDHYSLTASGEWVAAFVAAITRIAHLKAGR